MSAVFEERLQDTPQETATECRRTTDKPATTQRNQCGQSERSARAILSQARHDISTGYQDS